MKLQDKSIKLWPLLTGVGLALGLVLVLLISLQPNTALAQATVSPNNVQPQPQETSLAKTARIRNGNQRLFVITGTVAAATAEQVQIDLSLPKRLARKGQGKLAVAASKPVTFTVGASSLLFDKDLSKMAANALQVGSTVTISPMRAWGAPTIQLLFVGEPSQLATFEFHGQLVADQGDTLVLKPRDGEQFNVIVDTTTTWFEQGVVSRPAQIRTGLPLRVLGTKSENGDVKAVLITAIGPIGRMGRRAR